MKLNDFIKTLIHPRVAKWVWTGSKLEPLIKNPITGELEFVTITKEEF